MHLNHLLGVLLNSLPNVIYSLHSIRKVSFNNPSSPLELWVLCGCFVCIAKPTVSKRLLFFIELDSYW